MALTAVEQVRLLIQDNTPGLYIISDDEITYFLERNSQNINRTALECAKVVLLNLSMRGSESVDIFSISGNKSAEQYRMALQMFIRDPSLNPVFQNVTGYAGGISLADMQANVDNVDNNIIQTPLNPVASSDASFFTV